MHFHRLLPVSLLALALPVVAADCIPGFTEVTRLGLVEQPRSLAAADFDSDGRPDLAALAFGSRNLNVLLNKPHGFTRPAPVVLPAAANSVRGIGGDDLLAIGPDLIAVLDGAGNATYAITATTPGGDPLTGVVATADFNGDGRFDIAARAERPRSGGGAVRTIRIFLGAGNGRFTEGTSIPTLDPVAELRSGDLNGDRKQDLAVADNLRGLIFEGNDDGTFKASRVIDSTLTVTRLTVADFDEDGIDDLLANSTLLLSSQPGTKRQIQMSARATAADLDADGNLDLFSLRDIQRGNGDGTFTLAAIMTDSGPGLGSPILADFDRDGILDMAATTEWLDVVIHHGRGNLQFEGAWRRSVASLYAGTVAGDLNGDGRSDLVVVSAANQVVYLGQPDGTLVFKRETINGQNGSAALGDFDGDGKLDLFIDRSGLAFGNGDGTFGTRMPIPPSDMNGNAQPTRALAADLNGDGKLDVLSARAFDSTDGSSGEVAFLVNDGAGNFTRTATKFAASVHGIAAADFNRDGLVDVLAGTNVQYRNHELYLLDGRSPSTPVLIATDVQSEHIAVGDVDRDGFTDIVTVTYPADDLLIFGGNGNGTFRAPRRINVPNGTSASATLADFSGDGRLDVAVSVFETWDVVVFIQQPDGSFAESAHAPSNWYGDLAADIDGDGRRDLVTDTFNGGVVAHRNRCSTATRVGFHSTGSSLEGAAAIFVAEVEAGVTGTVGFYEYRANGLPRLVGSADLVSGRATLSTPTLAPGTHQLYAVYLGDGAFPHGRSASIEHDVTARVTGGGRRRSIRH